MTAAAGRVEETLKPCNVCRSAGLPRSKQHDRASINSVS